MSVTWWAVQTVLGVKPACYQIEKKAFISRRRCVTESIDLRSIYSKMVVEAVEAGSCRHWRRPGRVAMPTPCRDVHVFLMRTVQQIAFGIQEYSGLTV